MRRVMAIVLVMLLSPGWAECALGAPKVVVTIKPLHALVAQVMTGVAVPETIVKGAVSPHSYALKPSDIRALQAADIVFRVSETIEPFITKVLNSLPDGVEVVSLQQAPGVMLLPRRMGAMFEPHETAHAGEGHHHVLGNGGASEPVDGHIWLDPDNALAMADRIVEVLSGRDPAHARLYASNAVALKHKLHAIGDELRQALDPVAGKPYIVSHDAFQYFERRYGLNAVGAIALSPEVPPGARRLAVLRQKIVSSSAVCVFGEPQLDGRLIANLTDGTAARTGTLDPEGFALEPGPELYFVLMRKLAQDLRSCLQPPT
jgi:zinc transport system substrate-binding protein